MSDVGYYVGYIDFKFTIYPSDFKITYSNNKSKYLASKYMIKEYLEDTFLYYFESFPNLNI